MAEHNFHIGTLPIPPMALGTMYFGTQVPAERAATCLDQAFDCGARFWDTANNYAFWAGGLGDESETVIGDWFTARGPSARDQVVLATKVGARPSRPGARLDDVLGLSRESVRTQVHDCLRRLRTDRIDVLYAHIDDRSVPLVETLGVLSELVEEGLVREVAASNLAADRLREAMEAPAPSHYCALQQRFSYLVPRPDANLSPHVLLDDEIVRLCGEHALTPLGYSPLLSGAYTRAERPLPEGYGPSRNALQALEEVAEAHELDEGQAVLAWMVGRGDPVVPVVGVSAPEQVSSAWQAVTTKLSTAELSRLDDARRG